MVRPREGFAGARSACACPVIASSDSVSARTLPRSSESTFLKIHAGLAATIARAASPTRSAAASGDRLRESVSTAITSAPLAGSNRRRCTSAEQPRAKAIPASSAAPLKSSAMTTIATLRLRQSQRQPDGGEDAAGVGCALPGDVAGSAVIDARADDRQAERRVHGRIEGEGLHWNVPLVVIHADEGVGRLPLPGQE